VLFAEPLKVTDTGLPDVIVLLTVIHSANNEDYKVSKEDNGVQPGESQEYQ